MTDEAPTIDQPTLDRLRALQREDEPSLVAELVQEFLARAPQRIARMRAALEAGDSTTLEFEAHGLAGSCGVLGVIRMRLCCLELETLVRQGSLAKAPTALEQVIRSLEEATPVLHEAARRG
jgi:HPt (histidine-containing phosphotransfer) domain-containing protein